MDGSTTLGDLDEEQRYAVFDDLQQHLPHVWDAMRRDRPEESAVVVPSISLERTTASSGTLMQAMEERGYLISREDADGRLGRRRKVYTSTEEGRRGLEIAREQLRELTGEVSYKDKKQPDDEARYDD